MDGRTMRFSFMGRICLVEGLCHAVREYRKGGGEGLTGEDERRFRKLLEEETTYLLEGYGKEEDLEMCGKALLAVMDAYEITGNGEQLQRTLEDAEQLLSELDDGAFKCRLLSYCYYYVEDPWCADEARRILDSWVGMRYDAEMREAEQCFEELVGGAYEL